jgi:hypothetical protein
MATAIAHGFRYSQNACSGSTRPAVAFPIVYATTGLGSNIRRSGQDLILKREYPGLRRHGFQDDAVAEGLELGDGPLPLALGIAPGEVVASEVLLVAVIGEQMPGNHQDRVPYSKGSLLLPDPAREPPVLGRQVAVATTRRRPSTPG